jgi:hypothetical protein
VLIQRPAGQAGEQDAKQTEGVVVAPSLARVEGERKLSQPGDPFVCSQRQRLGSGLRPVLGHGSQERRIGHRHPVAGGVSQ